VLSLVGDGDVAPGCPKVLHFHIADGLPERAQLYLRGGTISSLWYSELAQHTHDLNIVVGGDEWVVDFDHSHGLDGETEPAGAHRHTFWMDGADAKNLGGFEIASNPFDEGNSRKMLENDPDSPMLLSKEHSHALTNVTIGDPDRTTYTITPEFGASSIEEAGMGPGVRGRRAYSYFKELKVKLDGTVVTDKILEQLPTLAQLGVGESTTPDSEAFVTEGTAAIDLLLLGVDLLPGAHTLELLVPDSKGGGKLFYALYVD
jgi:hypothetical protein